MACSGRYAEAWQFSSFWCVSSVLSGVDTTVGAVGNAYLTDAYVNFLNAGIKPNVGMVLYNLTKGTHGYITAVTATTIIATGVTWDSGNSYRVAALNSQERSIIEHYLDIAASDLHSALAASGACDCTLAAWANTYLVKLNVIDAAIYHQCPCGKPDITDDMRRAYLEWMNQQLELIRTGKLELCDGSTGSDFPAVGWAEQATTDFNAAQIVINAEERDT